MLKRNVGLLYGLGNLIENATQFARDRVTVEANWDGKSKAGGPGSVIFFAAGATTFLRNAGTTPCTYIVVYYYTPLTPKS